MKTCFETPRSKSVSLLVVVLRRHWFFFVLLPIWYAIKKSSKDSKSSLFVVYLLRFEQTSELRSFASLACARTITYFEMHIAVWGLTTRVLAPHINYPPSICKSPEILGTSKTMSVQATGEAYEEEHVHTVYEQIASHFSSTRYKVRRKDIWTAIYCNGRVCWYLSQPWPIIERFLKGLAPGSVGLDVGCGNGKYLAVNRDIFIVGSDRYVRVFQ